MTGFKAGNIGQFSKKRVGCITHLNLIGLLKKQITEIIILFSLVLLTILIPALFFGCNDDGITVDKRSPGLYAKVVDASGNAISDVNVHYLFYFHTSNNPVVTAVDIEFNLPTSQVVTFKVFDPFNREVVTLVDGEQLLPGKYLIRFDLPVTNGVYTYKLKMGDSLQSGSFFIRDDDIARLQQKSPLITSDKNGEFFLSPSVLGIGKIFQGPSSTEIISDSISIVLVKANYKTLVKSFRLDTSKPNDKTFILELK